VRVLSIGRTVNAPLDMTWEIVADVENYARYAPNIDTSKVLQGNQEGLLRECSNSDGKWREVCTLWSNQDKYRFRVKTEEKGYPYPFSHLVGTWSVSTIDRHSSRIDMEFEVALNNIILEWLLFPLLKRKYLVICERLLDNWQWEIEQLVNTANEAIK